MRNPHKKHVDAIKALGVPIEWVPQKRRERVRQPPLPGFEGLPTRERCRTCDGRTVKDGKTCRTCRGSGFVPSTAAGTPQVGSGGDKGEVAGRDGYRTVSRSQDGGGGASPAGDAEGSNAGCSRMEASSDPFENGDLI